MCDRQEVYIILEEIAYDEGIATKVEGVYSDYARATAECERLNKAVVDNHFTYTYTVEEWEVE